MSSRALAAILVGLTGVVSATGAAAQQPAATAPRWPQPEMRIDAFFADIDAVHVAVGANRPLGNYVRFAAIVGGGVARLDDAAQASARADLLVRFVLDPFRQQRRGVAVGGGLSFRYDHEQMRSHLVILLGVEGSPWGGVLPAVEGGFGGGVRIGFVLRRAVAGRR